LYVELTTDTAYAREWRSIHDPRRRTDPRRAPCPRPRLVIQEGLVVMDEEQWEYQVYDFEMFNVQRTALLMHLNDLGARGWELVSQYSTMLLFKRKVRNR
jgi:hypothetical protein